MNHPLVSIVTIVYNNASAIENTILSVLNQSYSNIEYIIIDGGSTDGTIDILNRYSDKFTCFISESDKGIYYAMNKGIDKCNGEWINFMNSGDEFYDDHVIETIFSRQDISEFDLIYGNTEIKIDEDKKRVEIAGNSSNFWKKLIRHQSIFSKSVLSKKYKFNTEYKVSADFDFQYRVFHSKYKSIHLDLIISRFELIGFSHYNRFIGFRENRLIAKNYPGQALLKYKVSMHFLYITFFAQLTQFIKQKFPFIFGILKKIFSQ